WYDDTTGWRRALLREPRGSIRLGDREVRVRARPVRSERLYDAVDAAYAAKYTTKASQKWVRGFALPRRRKTTTELRSREAANSNHIFPLSRLRGWGSCREEPVSSSVVVLRAGGTPCA